MNIFYYCPTIIHPCGGVKQIYRHVDVLNNNGYNAAVVHSRKGFRVKWFDNKTRIVYSRRLAMELRCLDMYKRFPQFVKRILILISIIWDHIEHNYKIANYDDNLVVVLPESFLFLSSELLPGVKKVIFCQNHNYLLNLMDSNSFQQIETSKHVVGFISISEYITSFLKKLFSDKLICVVPNGIDTMIFNNTNEKESVIAYMPRKLRDESKIIVDILKKRDKLQKWKIIPIDNMSQTEVCEVLKKTKLFLSFNYLDGFGLPPVEALACGALVAGYTGQGGEEYFTNQFTTKIESHDILTYIEKVEGLVKMIDSDSIKFEIMSQQASNYVKEKYSLKIEEDNILKSWRVFCR